MTAAEFTSAAADTSNKSAVESKVNEQYDTDASMAFYEYVMGGGGDDIHYGLFLTEQDGLKESSQNSVEALANMAVDAGTLKKGADNGSVHCLDLGSGKGGASRWLAKEYGCKITAFNLGERQNAFNLERAKAAGIGHLVETHLGSFNEPLPGDWTDKYDMVWSQEAFCHCMDQKALMKEVSRVLKPGGVIVFSDIMQGDGGGDCTSFTGQNVVASMASPQMYKDAMTGAGMTIVEHKELTSHLTPYFKCMLQAVKDGKETMLSQGVTKERLDAYEDDLSTRFERVKQGHFAWDMFCAKN